jgi:hypothetical protein
MKNESIVDEIHRIREQILEEYGGDLRALVKAMQRKTEEAARAGRKVVALPPRRPEGWTEPTKKAG